jgi:hypothetical protein
VSGQAEQLAQGHCIGCGQDNVTGELVNEVETNSGPHWVNVRCPGCTTVRVRLPAAPFGFHLRRG